LALVVLVLLPPQLAEERLAAVQYLALLHPLAVVVVVEMYPATLEALEVLAAERV